MKTKGAKKMKNNKTKKSYVTTPAGVFVTGAPVLNHEAFDTLLPEAQRQIDALPSGKSKTVIQQAFANLNAAYGYVRGCGSWLGGISGSPIEA